MDLPRTIRQFYPDEQRVLKALKTKKEKELKAKVTYKYFLVAGLLGIGFTYLATMTAVDVLVFIFGTLAVFAYSFIVFMPYELYKGRKRLMTFIHELDTYIERGTVETYLVNAKKVALAKEYEDEGDLFIVEYDTGKVLYLWDYDSNLKKKFPCLNFEIYEDKFYKLIGRQVYPLSEPIKPLIIDKKAKWTYMKRVGVPGHLETANHNLDRLIDEYNGA